MLGFLHDLLLRGDMQGETTFSNDEVEGLSGEDLSLLVGMGVLRQPGTNAGEGWALDHDGLVAWLARSLGCKAGTGAIVPGRTWYAGFLRHAGRHRELFVARGLAWPDGRDVIAQSRRLCVSSSPVVLVYAQMPSLDSWQACCPAVGSLRELGRVHGCQLLVDWDVLISLPRVALAPRPALHDVIIRADARQETVLTRSELHILRAMANDPQRPFHLSELIDRGGYGKLTTRRSLARLRDLGLIAKPPGTSRKGDAITSRGLAFLDGRQAAIRSSVQG